jgi:hypothetical protein
VPNFRKKNRRGAPPWPKPSVMSGRPEGREPAGIVHVHLPRSIKFVTGAALTERQRLILHIADPDHRRAPAVVSTRVQSRAAQRLCGSSCFWHTRRRTRRTQNPEIYAHKNRRSCRFPAIRRRLAKMHLGIRATVVLEPSRQRVRPARPRSVSRTDRQPGTQFRAFPVRSLAPGTDSVVWWERSVAAPAGPPGHRRTSSPSRYQQESVSQGGASCFDLS